MRRGRINEWQRQRHGMVKESVRSRRQALSSSSYGPQGVRGPRLRQMETAASHSRDNAERLGGGRVPLPRWREALFPCRPNTAARRAVHRPEALLRAVRPMGLSGEAPSPSQDEFARTEARVVFLGETRGRSGARVKNSAISLKIILFASTYALRSWI
jgi:hypothetical protein